jgi:hypothetical protein
MQEIGRSKPRMLLPQSAAGLASHRVGQRSVPPRPLYSSPKLGISGGPLLPHIAARGGAGGRSGLDPWTGPRSGRGRGPFNFVDHTSVPNDQRLRRLMLPAIAISALLWVVIGTLIAMGMHWIW